MVPGHSCLAFLGYAMHHWQSNRAVDAVSMSPPDLEEDPHVYESFLFHKFLGVPFRRFGNVCKGWCSSRSWSVTSSGQAVPDINTTDDVWDLGSWCPSNWWLPLDCRCDTKSIIVLQCPQSPVIFFNFKPNNLPPWGMIFLIPPQKKTSDNSFRKFHAPSQALSCLKSSCKRRFRVFLSILGH